ncbi:RICIN domain-containing protein [Sphaerisporangium sp. NPDC051011]|uniref:RICIN domain-containing protein n=1 Tax=Sphaerisporangium sp. NPDC051011 TaxID=3155792 RepID=UPI0033D3D3EF
MRTRKFLAIATAGLVALVATLVGTTPANAMAYPLHTYVSVFPQTSTKMVLDVLDGQMNSGAPVQLWERNGNSQQTWDIYQGPDLSNGHHWYRLFNGKSKLCLDMATDGPVGNGTRVQQWGCGSSDNQYWVAYPVESSGQYAAWVELRPKSNQNLCLDVSGANYGNGARLQVWQCHHGWNQRFNIS